MNGIFNITWADKKNKPAISFEITEVQELAGAYLPVKGSKVENHLIEISEEIDGNKAATLAFIQQTLNTQGIEVMNFSDRLNIK